MRKVLIENFGGYFNCKSTYFYAHCTVDNYSTVLDAGINYLCGDIDSQGFCLSYALSMYNNKKEKGTSIILDDGLNVIIDNTQADINYIAERAFYMDKLNPLAKKRVSVKQLVKKGLKKSGLDLTAEQVRDLFDITKERFDRPIKQVGNERYLCLAAIGFAYGKEIFCFPWFSEKMFNYFKHYFLHLVEVLESQNKIIILPTNTNVDN